MPMIMGGIAVSVLLVAVISYFYKISAHAVGICGALGYTLVISYFFPYEEMIYPVAVFILLAGLLLSARLNLNVHTPGQVFTGGLFGLVISILSFIFFRYVGLYLLDNYYY
jgi:membrane-associated phospholipid phosphatase